MLKNLRNVEFSKRLLIFIEVLVLLCFCLVAASVLMGDSSPLTAFITGVFSLASLAFGFYFWKARSENIRKYAKTVTPEDAVKLAKMYDKIFNQEGDKP
jgi:hypothetical protein